MENNNGHGIKNLCHVSIDFVTFEINDRVLCPTIISARFDHFLVRHKVGPFILGVGDWKSSYG